MISRNNDRSSTEAIAGKNRRRFRVRYSLDQYQVEAIGIAYAGGTGPETNAFNWMELG